MNDTAREVLYNELRRRREELHKEEQRVRDAKAHLEEAENTHLHIKNITLDLLAAIGEKWVADRDKEVPPPGNPFVGGVITRQPNYMPEDQLKDMVQWKERGVNLSGLLQELNRGAG